MLTFGTILNLTGIAIGALAGWALRRPLAASQQQFLKAALGLSTVFVGLRITVLSFGGSFWHIVQQFIVLLLALILGRLLGRLCRIQRGLNRLGQIAKTKLANTQTDSPTRASDGFLAATILFCAAPLAVLGPFQDGLAQNFQPLLLKAVMDGLVTMAFVLTFGWTVILAAFPLAAFLITLTHGAQWIEPTLRAWSLVDSVNGVCGLLIFCVALIMFEIRKIDLGDYLPALVVAPWLTWIWR